MLGDGPVDLVFVAEFWNSMEAQWEQPDFERFLRRLATFSRLICFDQRGTGLSDPVALSALPTLERWMDDVRAVMDAVGSTRAALLGSGGGGVMSMLFAATYPEQTAALVLINSFARLTRTAGYPMRTSPEFEERIIRELRYGWGRGVLLETVCPSRAGDPAFRAWWARYQRLGSSPGTVIAMRRVLEELDVRDVLSAIAVPTLIFNRRENRLVEVVHSRYLAEHIPGARYVELDGEDYFPFVGNSEAILDGIEELVTGSRASRAHDRVLATVLFTDIVGSTERAAAMGDHAWRELLDRHNDVVRRELGRFRGREVDDAGDGFLALFDGPARAIDCAWAIGDALRPLGIQIRAGLHTGEVDVAGPKGRGIAIHIGARVAAMARPGEVLVTRTVRDLVAGSGIGFEERGEHELKGVPGTWALFSVSNV